MRTTVIRRLLLPALLAIHAGLLAYGAAIHSPSIDEVGHLAAGLSHWQLGCSTSTTSTRRWSA